MEIQLSEIDQHIIHDICSGVVVSGKDDAEVSSRRRAVTETYAAAFLAAKRFALGQPQGTSIHPRTILEQTISWVGIFRPLESVGDKTWRQQKEVEEDLTLWSNDVGLTMDADWAYCRLRRISSLVDGNMRISVLWWMVLDSIHMGQWPTRLPNFERIDLNFDQLREHRAASR